MNKDTLHLWCAYPDDLLEEEAANAAVRLLNEEELARSQRFKFDRHRREYLATHALARIALSHAHALPPEAWRFQLNAYGKPSIDPECELRFNLSNSVDLVVCLIGEDVDVGVDVEPRKRAASILEVAPRMFSPQELAQLEALREDERPERALQLWTLKEAYIKARGMGLALPTNKFSFVFEGEKEISMAIDPSLGDEAGRWRFCLVEHVGHCIALMVESSMASDLRCWEARPPFAAPRQLELANDRWFPRRE
jgi:4'-phosphopantetheinyl transferase